MTRIQRLMNQTLHQILIQRILNPKVLNQKNLKTRLRLNISMGFLVTSPRLIQIATMTSDSNGKRLGAVGGLRFRSLNRLVTTIIEGRDGAETSSNMSPIHMVEGLSVQL
ncbi:hypothetical protein DJ71_15975 [Halorubrum sp. E3]|nr:hypothetical protein DJ71_15975 [Halorubrum sp. E3]